MGTDKDFSMFVKSGMYCTVFSCVVYSRLKAFGKVRLTEKLSILQYLGKHLIPLIFQVNEKFVRIMLSGLQITT